LPKFSDFFKLTTVKVNEVVINSSTFKISNSDVENVNVTVSNKSNILDILNVDYFNSYIESTLKLENCNITTTSCT
jgi:hypothetical protein